MNLGPLALFSPPKMARMFDFELNNVDAQVAFGCLRYGFALSFSTHMSGDVSAAPKTGLSIAPLLEEGGWALRSTKNGRLSVPLRAGDAPGTKRAA